MDTLDDSILGIFQDATPTGFFKVPLCISQPEAE